MRPTPEGEGTSASAEESPDVRAQMVLREVGRTEFFSDAVLAIGLTLLALDLSITGYREATLADRLLNLWPTYLAFLVSFIYVGVMWMNHHAAFDRLKALSFPLQWANMGILLGAVVLSFPTAVLAEAFQNHNLSDERAAVVLYGLLAYAMGLSWWLFFLIILRNPHLWKHPGDHAKWRKVTIWAFFGSLGYLVAIAAGVLLDPRLALVLFFVLVFYRSTQARRIATG